MKKYLKNICFLFFLLILLRDSVLSSNVLYTFDNHTSGPGINIVETFSDGIIPVSTESNIYVHDGVKYIKGESLGNFSLSGYCACKKCGTGTGITASGHPVRENHTIAADWSILPKGTFIILENAKGKDGTIYDGVYEVEDRGGGIKNKRLDIYRPTHDLASLVTYYGRCYGDVYIAVKIEDKKE